MQQSYPGINPSISDWKGQEITDFQEDLLARVHANISEKWFYMHFKSEHTSLPRVDVLNLLSRYVGYANWNDLIFNNPELHSAIPSTKKTNRYFILVPLLVILIMLLFYGLFRVLSVRDYRICFFDAVTREPIAGQVIEVRQLNDEESHESHFCGPDGCLELRTGKRFIRLAISSPYYRPDTIERILKKWNHAEMIALRADDYALVLHYFSQMDVEGWNKRRTMLDGMIDERAMIYQVHSGPGSPAMELFNKGEFIDKLTFPASSLKNIEVLDTRYTGDKIIILKFRMKE